MHHNTSSKLPLVSICIPCYNASSYIVETIDSVLSQTYKNIEIIVINDKSTDNSREIIVDKYTGKITLVDNEVNIGMIKNYQKCMHIANGEFVKVLCADDILESTFIEEQVNVFLVPHNEDVVYVSSAKNIINDNSKIIGGKMSFLNGKYNNTKVIKRCFLLGNNIIGETSGGLMRTNIRASILPLSTNHPYAVDVELIAKILLHGKFYFINKKLYNYRLAENSQSSQLVNKQLKQFVDLAQYLGTVYSGYKLNIIEKMIMYCNATLVVVARLSLYKYLSLFKKSS